MSVLERSLRIRLTTVDSVAARPRVAAATSGTPLAATDMSDPVKFTVSVLARNLIGLVLSCFVSCVISLAAVPSAEGEAATMIILIFAGWYRMNMIRRELPRSNGVNHDVLASCQK